MKNHAWIIGFLFATLIAGCASVSYLPTDESVTYNPTNKVEVFWQPPDRDYIIIGKIVAESSDLNEEQLFKRLKERARKVGAHAIIPGGTSTSPEYYSSDTYGFTMQSHRIEAMAIRFK